MPFNENNPITISQVLQELNEISSKLDNLLMATEPAVESSQENVYYDVTEVAKLCKVAPRTIYSWVRKGLLDANRATGRLLFKQEDVETFLLQRNSRRQAKRKERELELERKRQALTDKEAEALAREKSELYEIERAYQIAHAYEINRPYNSHYHTCLIVKERFHINTAELKRCCQLYETWNPTIS